MATKAELAALGARIDALAQKQDGTAALARRMDTLEQGAQTRATGLAGIKQEIATLQTGAAGIERLARLQAAAVALDAGTPVGTIPDAPPALARYATAAPPTVSALRLSFPAAARAAAAASRPDVAGKSLLSRMWARVQNVVTVRQGNHVVVGDPASGHARRRAIGAGRGRSRRRGGAARASCKGRRHRRWRGWLGQAQALLAARAAIAEMQAHA